MDNCGKQELIHVQYGSAVAVKAVRVACSLVISLYTAPLLGWCGRDDLLLYLSNKMSILSLLNVTLSYQLVGSLKDYQGSDG